MLYVFKRFVIHNELYMERMIRSTLPVQPPPPQYPYNQVDNNCKYNPKIKCTNQLITCGFSADIIYSSHH